MDESAANVQMQRCAAQLCSFLHGRCGSIKAAYAALDRHKRGQVSRDDFEHGLRELGFIEDASAIFQALDTAGTGQISFQLFAKGIWADSVQTSEEKAFSMAPLRSNHAQAALRPAGIQRCQSDSTILPPTLLPKPPMLGGACPPLANKSESQTPKSTCVSHPGSPANSGVKISSSLEARVVHLEDQLSFEQSQRLETELRLTQYLHAAIAEEFDALKKQLVQEQDHRFVLKTELLALRSKVNGFGLTGNQDVANQLRKLESKIDGFISDCEGKRKGSIPCNHQSWSGSTSASCEDGTDSQHPSSLNGHERLEGPGARPETANPKLTTSTMLRQENYSLREQNIRLREKVVEAMERERMCAVAMEKETVHLREEQLRHQKMQELSKSSKIEGPHPLPPQVPNQKPQSQEQRRACSPTPPSPLPPQGVGIRSASPCSIPQRSPSSTSLHLLSDHPRSPAPATRGHHPTLGGGSGHASFAYKGGSLGTPTARKSVQSAACRTGHWEAQGAGARCSSSPPIRPES